MKQQTIIITAVVAVLMAGGGFFAGMQYQKMQRSNFAQFANGQGGPGGQNRRFGGNGQNGNIAPVRGQITSSDSGSITVKMTDGSSKIVVLSGATTISESATASAQALQPGKEVMVIGQTNSDGSVTAQNVQLNPMSGGFFRVGGNGGAGRNQ
jgi:hypothetical protein